MNAFIPSELDDAGLTAAQFRVFARIVRRGDCRESVPNMAKGCRLKADTVWGCLKILTELRMVRKEVRPGRCSIYTATPCEEWIKPTPNEGAPQTRGRVPKQDGTHPKEAGNHPPQTRGHKGNPIEGNPLKVLPRENSTPSVDLPSGLQTERLKLKWSEWMSYRLKRAKCKNPEAMFREQSVWLAQFDEPTALEILSQSIRNGWQGLFPLKNSPLKQAVKPAPNAQF